MEIRRAGEAVWEIAPEGGMRVPGRVYATEKLFEQIRRDRALEQVANVAHLPGILRHSLAMPDIHWGYGFPIGGVAAFDLKEGSHSIAAGEEHATLGPHGTVRAAQGPGKSSSKIDL